MLASRCHAVSWQCVREGGHRLAQGGHNPGRSTDLYVRNSSPALNWKVAKYLVAQQYLHIYWSSLDINDQATKHDAAFVFANS